MLHPSQVKEMAEKNADKNDKFRRYLKGHADEEELDQQFLELHNELFIGYDCESCRNCCIEQHPVLEEDEIAPIAEYLQLSKEVFSERHLGSCEDGEYPMKGIPCIFYKPGEPCQIKAIKPRSCIEYPYTDRPERLFCLMGIINSSYVCPVVYEILERLKREYNFR